MWLVKASSKLGQPWARPPGGWILPTRSWSGLIEAVLGFPEVGLGLLKAGLGLLEAELGLPEAGKGYLGAESGLLEAGQSHLEA